MTPEQRAARSERRAVAKRHHPDLGGDADVFAEEMRRLDAAGPFRQDDAPAPGSGSGGRPVVVVHRTARGRAARLLRSGSTSLISQLRHRLPRSFPGSRRYGRL